MFETHRALSAEYELERTDGDSTTPLYWARIAALQNTHIRLIRFHRPFVSRGYRDPAYRGSTEAALASARVVLETQKELDRTNAPLVKDWCVHARTTRPSVGSYVSRNGEC